MEIGSATSPFTAGLALSQKAATTGTQQADAAASTGNGSRIYQRAMGTTAGGASDLLGNNFVHADSGQSKYVAATIMDLQTDMSFSDKMGSLLGSLDAQYAALTGSGVSKYAAAAIMQHKVKEGVKQVTNDEYMDQSADNLDNLKDDIEKRAEEATQPQDPSQGDAADTSQTADAADASTATTPGDQDASTGQDAGQTADTQQTDDQTAPATETATGAGASNATGAATPPAAVSGNAATSETAQNPSLLPPTTVSLDILV
ncbi:conserved hypothetical protein [Solidesulfovibrio fructosivorans JJ]]|uniref:Uncharacterized protein n=1 Tax=Solidesulfovibrio fructosivorans JJ] TaxID=596151 RepID=E1JTK0_SOLFR|nr:hypothetical protein [Solidesulfovibrio fructosivorans]EFL52460.1 conserved hypothetical protein [Solidesulfovibrio fructosivorans JJ]]